MAATLISGNTQLYIGAAADVKPTGVVTGSHYIAYDTGALFVTYDGTNWAQIDTIAQIGAGTAVMGKVRLVDSGGTEITEATGHTVKVTPVATEAHLGEVGGKTVTISVTPTLTVHATYAANDYVGTSGAPMEFAGATRIAAGSGTIMTAILHDFALQSVAGELWLFKSTMTPPDDSAAWSISDAHNLLFLGAIPFSTYYASALNSVSQVNNVGISFKLAAGTSIFGCFVTRGAPALASGDLSFDLVILQD
jgi:hypothetical protein